MRVSCPGPFFKGGWLSEELSSLELLAGSALALLLEEDKASKRWRDIRWKKKRTLIDEYYSSYKTHKVASYYWASQTCFGFGFMLVFLVLALQVLSYGCSTCVNGKHGKPIKFAVMMAVLSNVVTLQQHDTIQFEV